MTQEYTLLIATGNAHKVEEIRSIFQDAGLTGWRLTDLSAYPDYIAPEENGDTFSANAVIKAAAAAAYTGLPTLADDSGLCVDALGGDPGVHSARYAGEPCDDAANRAKLLQALEETPKTQRKAAFVCVAALAVPNAEGDLSFWTTEGRCEGKIALEEKGEGGFGYDSLFEMADGKTLAEFSAAEKNHISHRYHAMFRTAQMLQKLLEE